MSGSLLTILPGDCRETLATLTAESVQTCVTSPPYYGLRDYGTGSWEGGDPACDHTRKNPREDHNRHAYQGTRGVQPSTKAAASPQLQSCRRCGAQRTDRQIGLEQTPEDYVAEMVAVFREVRRVLRADGTLWLNLGDSYANDTKWGGVTSGKHAHGLHGHNNIGRCRHLTGLPSKNLIGIPWRVAFALQADGWILRSDIIWSKPNPMPESITDRPTKAHEYLFLFAKSERYFYDQEAIKEPAADREDARAFGAAGGNRHGDEGRIYSPRKSVPRGGFNGKTQDLEGREAFRAVVETRNKRTVWTIPSQPYKGAHFACFPPDLIKPCILAGSRGGDVVLDPFGGSGTTGAVALEFGRRAVLCELNPDYCDLIRRRCDVTPGFPLDLEVAA